MEEKYNTVISPGETIATAPRDLRITFILFKRDKLLFEIEQYYLMKRAGGVPPPNKLTTALLVLFYEVRSSYRRSSTVNDYNKLYDLCTSSDPLECIKGFNMLDDWLDSKNVTKFDTLPNLNRSRVEETNTHNGY